MLHHATHTRGRVWALSVSKLVLKKYNRNVPSPFWCSLVQCTPVPMGQGPVQQRTRGALHCTAVSFRNLFWRAQRPSALAAVSQSAPKVAEKSPK